MIDVRILFALVKKEILDGVRNRWIFGVTLIFLLLTLVTSYFGAAGGGGSVGFQGFRETAGAMGATSQLIVPLLALMLGYAAVAGEREQGSLGLLLSTPLSRLELLLGKFLGLTAILCVAILAGYGLAGSVVAALAGTAWWEAYLSLLGATILLGAAFVAISLLFSSLLQKRSTALGAAVVMWFFFTIIYQVILIGVYVGTGGSFQPPGPGASSATLPAWYWAAELANPSQAFALFTSKVFSTPFGFGGMVAPSFVTPATCLVGLLLWILVPMSLAYGRFRNRDV